MKQTIIINRSQLVKHKVAQHQETNNERRK